LSAVSSDLKPLQVDEPAILFWLLAGNAAKLLGIIKQPLNQFALVEKFQNEVGAIGCCSSTSKDSVFRQATLSA